MTVDRLSTGYVPEFDRDAEVGRQGELWVDSVADALAAGTAEVKTDERALLTGRVYVEFECRTASGWQPSGIARTKADVWVFVLGRQVLVAAPTSLVLRVARRAWRAGNRAECVRGSHPTKGVVIPLTVLLTWALDEVAA